MIDLRRSPLAVAPDLLGSVLCHAGVALRITEVEAYLGTDDPASHAFRGPTRRTEVMFGPAGHLYVYLSYGIHLAANIVCHTDGQAGAVLLRAGEVVAGHELARERRGAARRTAAGSVGRPPVPDGQLGRGPGCVGQALGLGLADSGAPIHQGDVDPGPDGFWLRPAVPGSGPAGATLTSSGPRVGVSRAADEPWRFWLTGEPSVSAYQRSRRAPVAGQADPRA